MDSLTISKPLAQAGGVYASSCRKSIPPPCPPYLTRQVSAWCRKRKGPSFFPFKAPGRRRGSRCIWLPAVQKKVPVYWYGLEGLLQPAVAGAKQLHREPSKQAGSERPASLREVLWHSGVKALLHWCSALHSGFWLSPLFTTAWCCLERCVNPFAPHLTPPSPPLASLPRQRHDVRASPPLAPPTPHTHPTPCIPQVWGPAPPHHTLVQVFRLSAFFLELPTPGQATVPAVPCAGGGAT